MSLSVSSPQLYPNPYRYVFVIETDGLNYMIRQPEESPSTDWKYILDTPCGWPSEDLLTDIVREFITNISLQSRTGGYITNTNPPLEAIDNLIIKSMYSSGDFTAFIETQNVNSKDKEFIKLLCELPYNVPEFLSDKIHGDSIFYDTSQFFTKLLKIQEDIVESSADFDNRALSYIAVAAIAKAFDYWYNVYRVSNSIYEVAPEPGDLDYYYYYWWQYLTANGFYELTLDVINWREVLVMAARGALVGALAGGRNGQAIEFLTIGAGAGSIAASVYNLLLQGNANAPNIT